MRAPESAIDACAESVHAGPTASAARRAIDRSAVVERVECVVAIGWNDARRREMLRAAASRGDIPP